MNVAIEAPPSSLPTPYDRAVSALVVLLSDPDREVRIMAAKAILDAYRDGSI